MEGGRSLRTAQGHSISACQLGGGFESLEKEIESHYQFELVEIASGLVFM